MRAIYVAFLLMLPAVSQAVEDEKAAEYERLATNMVKLAERNSWEGVEKNFQQMLDGKHDIQGGEWLIGAQSARKTGDVALVLERLEGAKTAGEDDQADVWMTAIRENYRQVELVAKPGTDFSTDNRPFNPDYVVTIEYVAAQIRGSGKFEGLIPVWSYQFGEEALVVEAGEESLALDIRKVEQPPEPEPEPVADVTPDPAAVSLAELTPPEPTRAPPIARVTLLAAAGVAAGFSGAYYGAGRGRYSQWNASTDVNEIYTLQYEANTYARWSAIAGGAALGLGVGGVIAAPKKR